MGNLIPLVCPVALAIGALFLHVCLDGYARYHDAKRRRDKAIFDLSRRRYMEMIDTCIHPVVRWHQTGAEQESALSILVRAFPNGIEGLSEMEQGEWIEYGEESW